MKKKRSVFLLILLLSAFYTSCNNQKKEGSEVEPLTILEDRSAIFNKNQLNFISSLPEANYQELANDDLPELKPKVNSRGPFNVGGRTRSVAVDLQDESHMLSAGVSGDLWQTFDGGQTWSKVSLPVRDVYGISSIVQDSRPGFRHIWYCGKGNKGASLSGASSTSILIFRSTDNGNSWNPLLGYEDLSNAQTMSFIDRIIVSPLDGNLVVAGGTRVITVNIEENNIVIVNSIGLLFPASDYVKAGMEQFSTGELIIGTPVGGRTPDKIIYRSLDGSWQDITPEEMEGNQIGLPESGRMEVALSNIRRPDGSRDIYIFSYGNLPNEYPYNYRLFHGTLRVNNGVAVCEWEDRSANLEPASDYLAQGTHNMCIGVHPNDPDLVYIGSKAFICSTDGFRSDDNVKSIGGLHPDNHKILFYPSNPDHMIVANDGGVYKTNNCRANLDSRRDRIGFEWEELNSGYVTTQAYSVAIPPTGRRTAIATGLQDQGSRLSFNKNRDDRYVKPTSSDGMFCQFSNDGRYLYTTNQYGNIPRISVDYATNTFERQEDEIWSETDWSGRPFFVLDQNQDGLAYVIHESEYINRYRNFNVNFNVDARIEFPLVEDDKLSTLALSKEPANILYVATKFGHLYRVENADRANPRIVEISRESFIREEDVEEGEDQARVYFIENTNRINCIAVDPWDGRRVFVTFSGEGVPSIFYSQNSGDTWTNVDGNLSGGLSPSVRYLAVRRLDNRRGYSKVFLGTGMGLFSTKDIHLTAGEELNPSNIQWKREALESIGAANVTMIQCRTSDGMVAVSTYGKGLFSFSNESYVKDLGSMSITVEEGEKEIDLSCFNFEIEGEVLNYLVTASSDESVVSYNVDGDLLNLEANLEGTTYLTLETNNGDLRSRGKLRVDVIDEGENILYDQGFEIVEASGSSSFIKRDFERNIDRYGIKMSDDFEIERGSSWLVEEFHVEGKIRQPFQGGDEPTGVRLNLYREEGGEKQRVLMRYYDLERDTRIEVLPHEASHRYSFKMHLGEQTRLGEGRYWLSVMAVFREEDERALPWLWRNELAGGNAIENRVDSRNGQDIVTNTNRKLWFRVLGEIENAWRYSSPRNIFGEANNSGIQLSWELPAANNINPPEEILLERNKNGSDYTPVTILTYGSTSYYDDHNIADGLYQYRLKVLQAGRRGSNYAESNEVLIGDPVKIPAEFRILSIDSESAILLWESDFVGNLKHRRADELILERRFYSYVWRNEEEYVSDFEEVAVINRNTWVYVDQLPYSGVYYEYRLTARNRLGSASSLSGERLSRFNRYPENVRVTLNKLGEVNITWGMHFYGVNMFKLWRKIGDNEPVEMDNTFSPWDEQDSPNFDLHRSSFTMQDDPGMLIDLLGVNNVYYAIEVMPFWGNQVIMSDWVPISNGNNNIGIEMLGGGFRFESKKENKEINVYPNPFLGNVFHLELPEYSKGIIQVSIADLSGKEVFFSELFDQKSKLIEIDLSRKVNAGVYFLTVKTENNKTYRSKVIKK